MNKKQQKADKEIPFTSLLYELSEPGDLQRLNSNEWVYLDPKPENSLYKMESSVPLLLNPCAIDVIDVRKSKKNNITTAEINLYLGCGHIFGFYVPFERLPEFLDFIGITLKNELPTIQK